MKKMTSKARLLEGHRSFGNELKSVKVIGEKVHGNLGRAKYEAAVDLQNLGDTIVVSRAVGRDIGIDVVVREVEIRIKQVRLLGDPQEAETLYKRYGQIIQEEY